jgi:glycosyltransferase involved in cell wall biosynthesis
MPAYRSEATIREAVESVLAQTVPALELIVVDDASPTPVLATLDGMGDPRLRVIRHRRNRGAAAARNTALNAARSPLVSQLDADDAWEPGYLEAVLPAFEDPTVGLAYTNATIVGHPTGHDDYIGDPSVHPMDRFPKLAEQNPIPALTATMRADAVRGVGGYATWLWAAGDYYLYARLVMAGWRFAYVHRRLARYRWPAAGRGKSSNRRRVEREELKMWLAFVARHPLTPGPRRQVRTRARREVRLALDAMRS